MSVDIIMYRVAKLDEDDKALLKGTIVDEVECPDDGWDYKFYSQSDVDKEPERYSEIIKFARKMKLRRIVTNAKQCYIDHGMPADVKCYSSSYSASGITIRWNENSIYIPREILNKYSHEEKTVYYGIKRQRMEGDLSNWTTHSIKEKLEAMLGCDLSYRPHRMDKETADIICQTLLTMYDEGEIYPSEDIFCFIMEMMRVFASDGTDKIFIEFQN